MAIKGFGVGLEYKEDLVIITIRSVALTIVVFSLAFLLYSLLRASRLATIL